MTVPLSDTQLAEIRARKAAASGGGRWILLAGRTADEYRVKAIVGEDEVVVGSLEFGAGLAARDDKSFVVNAGRDIAALLAEVDRLRELMAPAQLAEWAEQLQSADLTPHPAFAWCSTTSGYEAAFQVATTDRLTDAARERLLAELRVAFDETVRRVLGYRPAAAPSV